MIRPFYIWPIPYRNIQFYQLTFYELQQSIYNIDCFTFYLPWPTLNSVPIGALLFLYACFLS